MIKKSFCLCLKDNTKYSICVGKSTSFPSQLSASPQPTFAPVYRTACLYMCVFFPLFFRPPTVSHDIRLKLRHIPSCYLSLICVRGSSPFPPFPISCLSSDTPSTSSSSPPFFLLLCVSNQGRKVKAVAGTRPNHHHHHPCLVG